MNLSYFIKYLWKKKWVIIIPTAIAIVAAWFFSRHEGQTYTSVAEISTGYMDVDLLNNGSRNSNTLFNNVVQTLQSRQVLDQVTYHLLLHDLAGNHYFRQPDKMDEVNQILNQYPGGKTGLIAALKNNANSFYVLNMSYENDRLIGKLAGIYGYSPDALMNYTQIKRIEGSDFINITSTTKNPQLSAFIANGICKSFLAIYQNAQGQAFTTSLDTLKNIVAAKKQILDSKLKLLQGGTDLSISNSVGMLGTLQAQLLQQNSNLVTAQVSLDNINKEISAANKQGGLSNNEEIISLKSELNNLQAKYVNNGANDPELLEEISKLRHNYQQKLSAAGSSASAIPLADLMKRKMDLETQVDVAKRMINDLQSKINSLNSVVQSSADKSIIIQSIQNEIEVARQEYLNARHLYDGALKRNIFPGNNFKQTLIASPPLYPDPSKQIKIIGFAGVGVFCILVFILLFFEFIDPGIKAPSYLKEAVPLPLLANLKRINMKVPVEEIFSANGSLPDYKKGFREQVKQLRYEVENSGNKIFLVTGYHSKAGRTTLVQSLAGSLSLNECKILLIDTNFHNNSLTRKYNAEAALETFEPIGDSDAVNEKIDSMATSTEDGNIKVIGCGSGDHTPEEVLPEENLLSWLKNNTNNYDYILIDSAALDKGPDCKELLKYTDSIILLFAADQPLTEEDQKFIDFLKKGNIPILGVVLNKVNAYSLNI